MTANRPLNEAEMLAALEWYRAAGVDIAVGEEPVDRFAEAQASQNARLAARMPAATPAAAPRAAPPPPQPALPLDADPAEARGLAARAASLDELKSLLDAYEGCALKLRATQLVFADGNPEAEIMLIGEAPGGEEDRQGKPFVGRAGQLLDRMLASIGLDRTRVYIANTVPWRPPGNRNPTPQEIVSCQPFLHRQIELVAPRIIVTLGAVASQTMLGTSAGITRLRGRWQDVTINAHQAPLMATLHPAYLLRTPSAKQQAWCDMLSLKLRMRQENIGTA